MGGEHCFSPGRLPGGGGWFELGLEVFPVGWGYMGVSPVPLTPTGIACSRQAPCICHRPRSVTAVSTNARPVTPQGPPLSATSSGCKVGPGLAARVTPVVLPFLPSVSGLLSAPSPVPACQPCHHSIIPVFLKLCLLLLPPFSPSPVPLREPPEHRAQRGPRTVKTWGSGEGPMKGALVPGPSGGLGRIHRSQRVESLHHGGRKLVITKSPEESCHGQPTRALGPHLARIRCSCGPRVKNSVYIFK